MPHLDVLLALTVLYVISSISSQCGEYSLVDCVRGMAISGLRRYGGKNLRERDCVFRGSRHDW